MMGLTRLFSGGSDAIRAGEIAEEYDQFESEEADDLEIQFSDWFLQEWGGLLQSPAPWETKESKVASLLRSYHEKLFQCSECRLLHMPDHRAKLHRRIPREGRGDKACSGSYRPAGIGPALLYAVTVSNEPAVRLIKEMCMKHDWCVLPSEWVRIAQRSLKYQNDGIKCLFDWLWFHKMVVLYRDMEQSYERALATEWLLYKAYLMFMKRLVKLARSPRYNRTIDVSSQLRNGANHSAILEGLMPLVSQGKEVEKFRYLIVEDNDRLPDEGGGMRSFDMLTAIGTGQSGENFRRDLVLKYGVLWRPARYYDFKSLKLCMRDLLRYVLWKYRRKFESHHISWLQKVAQQDELKEVLALEANNLVCSIMQEPLEFYEKKFLRLALHNALPAVKEANVGRYELLFLKIKMKYLCCYPKKPKTGVEEQLMPGGSVIDSLRF
ncbi:hypothetical protein [Candidatus Synchoanobacter obligatus]|uniref:Uncharacterized protein n=1 Tax=Candidatus Synchoanobacter obligatus TaxID=2919597 RepID=A0ABT1L4H6_9GAMM|nr:hypothetical protein [Candidatus Synchoanobacter obligatus]MCP8352079.1 hypothetical protein [Candidatus Synchoanobacter obligatus]